MNKITILLLLIGSAVLVIGLNRYAPVEDSLATPWSVEQRADGKIKILGITLGESQLNETLQHFTKRGKSYILIKPAQTLTLITFFQGITIDRLIANIELSYKTPQNVLQQLISQANNDQGLQKVPLSAEQLSRLSSAVADKLVYQPSINYGENLVLQLFGYPNRKEILSDDLQRWTYQDLHLQIYLNDKGEDKLVYTADIPAI